MQIILAGGGNATKSERVDGFYRRVLENRSVVYLPQAVAPMIWSIAKAEKWLRDREAMAGVEVRTLGDIGDLAISDINEGVSVFVMGGNTFHLLHLLQSHRQMAHLGQLAKERLIYGVSAGAILLGHDIASAALGEEADENKDGVFDLRGLNLLGGWNVYPHFGEKDVSVVEHLVKAQGRPVLAIPEDGGIWYDGVRFQSIGSGNVEVFCANGRRVRLLNGEQVDMKGDRVE
jgi:peptidase E